MVWIYTETEPKPVETRNHLARKQRTVNYDIYPLGDSDPTGYKFRYKAVTLEPGVWHYAAIVSALVNAEYPADKMQAVQNNYLADPTNDDAVEEMLEMQNWRASAKVIANAALDYINEAEGVQNSSADDKDTDTERG